MKTDFYIETTQGRVHAKHQHTLTYTLSLPDTEAAVNVVIDPGLDLMLSYFEPGWAWEAVHTLYRYNNPKYRTGKVKALELTNCAFLDRIRKELGTWRSERRELVRTARWFYSDDDEIDRIARGVRNMQCEIDHLKKQEHGAMQDLRAKIRARYETGRLD